MIYNDHPVYRFQGDKNAGGTNGQGLTAFGGWFALNASGDQVTAQPNNSSGGGNGY